MFDFSELFEDKRPINSDETNNQEITTYFDDYNSDDSNDSLISEINLEELNDELTFELEFPKNSVCAAHTLQLVLKDVFEHCPELREFNKVLTKN